MPLTREELGQRIRSARESCGFTQEQLGEAVELSRIAINQIEPVTIRSLDELSARRIEAN